MFQQFRFVQINADARSIRNLHAAVADRQVFVAEQLTIRHIRHHHLQHDEIRNARRKLQRRRVGHGARRIVRAETDMPRFRLRPQKTHLHDAARMGDVRLDVVRAVQFHELAVFIAVVEPFARRQRHADAILHFPHAFFIIRRNRLLEPEDIVFLQTAADFHSRRNVETAMPFDEQLDVLTRRLRDLFDALHGLVQIML